MPILMLLVACGKEPPASVAPASDQGRFIAVEERAAAMTSPAGWIACQNVDGTPGCLGDSLLFTGLAMGAADCEHGQLYQDAIASMGAVLSRHPSLTGQISLDGLLGFYWGVARRVRRCPDQVESLRDLFQLSRVTSEAQLEPYFGVVSTQVAADLGLGDPPAEDDRGILGAEVAAWSLATTSTHSAGYRIHLGMLALGLVSAPKGQAAFCASAGAAHIPLVEAFCGRDGLAEWLEAFQEDTWEYRHQRAAWESPDAAGRKTPGIDYLMGYAEGLK